MSSGLAPRWLLSVNIMAKNVFENELPVGSRLAVCSRAEPGEARSS
jgi:hypothetical protein